MALGYRRFRRGGANSRSEAGGRYSSGPSEREDFLQGRQMCRLDGQQERVGKLGREFSDHQTVNHSREEYVNKSGYSTNHVENFFLQFKRGMRGTFIHCEAQHVQRYLHEFSFRYSNRAGLGVSDADRAAMALKGIEGKRLTYRRPH